MSSTAPANASHLLVWDLCQNIVESSDAAPTYDVDSMKQIDSYSSSYFYNRAALTYSSQSTGGNEDRARDIGEPSLLGDMTGQSSSGMDGLHMSLVLAESSCQRFLSELDRNLETTNNITSSYYQISSRTNDLVLNCEKLLDKQAHLQATAENLKQFLLPFDDLEDISLKLGIPLETSTQASNNNNSNSNSNNDSGRIGNINTSISGSAMSNTTYAISDNKWKDFKTILAKLTKASSFIKQHPDYHDSDKFSKIIERLHIRATSLVAQSIKEHLEGAASVCRDLLAKNAAKKVKWNLDEMPLESSPLYQRFRSLSFRLRDLTALLHWNVNSENSGVAQHEQANNNSNSNNSGEDTSSNKWSPRGQRTESNSSKPNSNKPVEFIKTPDYHIIEDVFKSYVSMRSELLLPIIKDTASILIENINKMRAANKSPKASSDGSSSNGCNIEVNGLCSCIRQSFMLLLRLAQLEQQLFDSLFNESTSSSGDDANAENNPRTSTNAPATPAAAGLTISIPKKTGQKATVKSNFNPNSDEVLNIIQLICQGTHDSLRPLLIHESSVDELCKIVSVLVEDIRSQIVAMSQLSKPVVQLLLSILESTTQDAQERLVYLAEGKMRIEVQLFEPSEKDLIISPSSATSNSNSSGNIASDGSNFTDISLSWYPPLKTTLSLLSKLYGIIEMTVFEDLASRVVQYCVTSIHQSAEKVRKKQTTLHSDLFLLRNLLILREQLSPFEIRLLSIVKKLDFRPTTHVFSHLIATTGSAVVKSTAGGNNYNNGNSSDAFSNLMMSLIVEGLPSMEELKTDTKAELDKLLKTTCVSLRQDAVKVMLGSLEAFLAKVMAFADEIPVLLDDGRIIRSNQTIISQQEAEISDKTALLSTDSVTKLKKENFMKIDRIQELLLSLQQSSGKLTSDFRDLLKLYIENSIARTVILKPIQQEIDLIKRKMLCVISSCLEAGAARTTLEQSLDSTIFNILSELCR